jgi:hypothetical protein
MNQKWIKRDFVGGSSDDGNAPSGCNREFLAKLIRY